MPHIPHLEAIIDPIANDLTSGAAEIALRAITVFQTVLTESQNLKPSEVKENMALAAKAIVNAQPAMAPLFHLGNQVLLAIDKAQTVEEIQSASASALSEFDLRLCKSADKIADHVYKLIPPGEMVFAYSFSTTVVSSLLHARSKGKFFRAVCTESRPSMEGRKLATMLADGGLEVLHTFDSAMGLILPSCRVAFMGADSVGQPGIVNKVGSWLLSLACKELNIPLYVLCGTEKFVLGEQVFEFERHERAGGEVWVDSPKGVRVLNRQFELIPFSQVAGVVTEFGILGEADIDKHIGTMEVHEALKLETSAF